MKFLDDLKTYKLQRETAIQTKKGLLSQLKLDYQGKLDQVKDAETQYKSTFDDKDFDNLTALQAETAQLKTNMETADKMVSLMNVGQFDYDLPTLETEIDGFVSDLKFGDLKTAVTAAKENYLQVIKSYSDALKTANTLKTEIDSLHSYIPNEAKAKIIHVLGKHSSEFGPDETMYIKKYDNDILPRNLNANAITIYMKSNGGI